MKNSHVLTIKSRQIVDGQSNESEIVTSCELKKNSNNLTITYTENRANDTKSFKTTMIFENSGLVTILKEDDKISKLTLEKNARHLCNYFTEYGMITLGISTKNVAVDLDDSGGSAKLHYTLDVDTKLLSENVVTITVHSA